MLRLPKGKSVRQQVNPARINLPQAMEKLQRGRFSGYLRFDEASGSGIILFQEGRLISALYQAAEDDSRQIAYDALARIFEMSIRGHAQLNIYHLSEALAVDLYALFAGTSLRHQEDLHQLEVSAMLQQIADEQLSVCLRVYAGERTTLIFYDRGCALGFFVDGSTELQQCADLSLSVAADAGACLDMIAIQRSAQLAPADLMSSVDLAPIWHRIRKQLLEERAVNDDDTV